MKIKKPSPRLQQICHVAFPSYRGRKWRLEAKEKKSTNSYWDGGSRDTFVVVNLASLVANPIAGLNPLTHKPDAPVPITPGVCIVEHSIFCGKDTGITIHCHPNDFDSLLANCTVVDLDLRKP